MKKWQEKNWCQERTKIIRKTCSQEVSSYFNIKNLTTAGCFESARRWLLSSQKRSPISYVAKEVVERKRQSNVESKYVVRPRFDEIITNEKISLPFQEEYDRIVEDNYEMSAEYEMLVKVM